MRRFDRELRTFSPKDLQWLSQQITKVLHTPVIDGRPARTYTGQTDGVVALKPWHMVDAAEVIQPPKQNWQEPVILALVEDCLTFVVAYDGAVAWSRAPAQAKPGTAAAYQLTYEHLQHAGSIWRKVTLEAGDSSLRLSAEDSLLELSPPKDPRDPDWKQTFYRITPQVTQADWSSVWAQEHPAGVAFDPQQMGAVLSVLLGVTSHAGKDYARILRERKQPPTFRKQDHGAIWFDDGEVRVRLRSGQHQATASGLANLHFGIGRKDAEALIRALRLMTVDRRNKSAAGAGRAPSHPTWSKWLGLNVITNGDVGFAFPDPQIPRLLAPVVEDLETAASSTFSYSDLGEKMPTLAILQKELGDVIRLSRWRDTEGFFVQTKLGAGGHVALLTEPANNYDPAQATSGPTGHIPYNLADLTRFFSAIELGEVRMEILKRQTGEGAGLRYTQKADKYVLTSVFGTTNQIAPAIKNPVTLN